MEAQFQDTLAHVLNYFLLRHRSLSVLLLFVLLLSQLLCAAYNVRYFSIEISHIFIILLLIFYHVIRGIERIITF